MSEQELMVIAARKQLGKPYVWGTHGPDTFDCSGLTSYCYLWATGRSMSPSSHSQFTAYPAVAGRDTQRGDLIFWNTDGSGASHVAVAVGNAKVIHALNPERGVIESPISAPMGGPIIGVRRPPYLGAPDPPPPDPDPTGLVFGRVPKPLWTDRQIPDARNWAWDYLGTRLLRGIVYHRQLGTNWGTDGWFRGGGGGKGLTDFGIDHVSGETLEWNSYRGAGRTGVSPHRAGYASGPWASPPGDGRALVAKYGINVINRDLVSLEISGFYETPIAAAGFRQIIDMSAWLADQARVPWTDYPLNPTTGLTFTYHHFEFCGKPVKICSGGMVERDTERILGATKQRLRAYQIV